MKTQFTLYVSPYCIANGIRNSISNCILVLAVIESIPGALRVQVDKDEIRFSYRRNRYIYATPEKSAQSASDFDNGLVPREALQPWRDVLKDPISIEPSQYRRPRKDKKLRRRYVKPRPSNGPKAKRKNTRWGGRKI